LGAYGLRIGGLAAASRWLVPQPEDAARLDVVATVGPTDAAPHELDERSANLRLLGGGRLRMRRGEPVARFSFPRPVPDADLLHPYLTAACALFWQWCGREALHAGAFGLARGAVLVFGGKEAGKSSTLAWLAAERGATVLSDDLAIIDQERVLVGPRCIDVRDEGSDGRLVRDRRRTRLDLGAAPSAPRISATVVLRWGEPVSFKPVSPRDRLGELGAHRSYPPLTGSPSTLLWLASLPMFALTRPHDTARLPDATDLLLDELSHRVRA
jgi:hypothetical protein